MTKSEKLLEDVLSKHGIVFEPISESDIQHEKTPDYVVQLEGIDSYWEVKELEPNDDELAISRSFEEGIGEIYSVNSRRIRNSIKSACDQFKNYGVTDSPCVIVLFDARPFETKDLLFYPEVKAAMLGYSEYIESCDDSIKEISRKDALLTRKNKTYISAIVVIREHDTEAVVLHNPNAAFSLLTTEIKVRLNYHEIATFKDYGVVWERV